MDSEDEDMVMEKETKVKKSVGKALLAAGDLKGAYNNIISELRLNEKENYPLNVDSENWVFI